MLASNLYFDVKIIYGSYKLGARAKLSNLVRHMNSLSLMTQGLFICVLLSSCTPVPIIIPLFPEEPLQEEELQFLKPGETTLEEIKGHLWEPLATRHVLSTSGAMCQQSPCLPSDTSLRQSELGRSTSAWSLWRTR